MNKKDKDYYLSLPWHFEFTQAPDGGYYARVKELMCHSYGSTIEEALINIKETLEDHISESIEGNYPLPEPFTEDNVTGRLSIRTKKSMHLKLLKISQEEGVSISHLINDAIVKVYV